MSPARYTINELMVVELARHLRNDEIGFVEVGTSGRAFSLVVGIPLAAGQVAQLTTAPRFDLQIGPIIGPEMQELPERWNDATVYSWAASGLFDGADNLDFFAKGGVDVGFVSGAQIDQFGNLNVTWIKGSDGRRIRLIGCLALPEHQACAKQAVIMADLDPRVFVREVDYITGVGWLRGGRSREEAGITIGGGPQLVVTDKAIFDFCPEFAPHEGQITSSRRRPRRGVGEHGVHTGHRGSDRGHERSDRGAIVTDTGRGRSKTASTRA